MAYADQPSSTPTLYTTTTLVPRHFKRHLSIVRVPVRWVVYNKQREMDCVCQPEALGILRPSIEVVLGGRLLYQIQSVFHGTDSVWVSYNACDNPVHGSMQLPVVFLRWWTPLFSSLSVSREVVLFQPPSSNVALLFLFSCTETQTRRGGSLQLKRGSISTSQSSGQRMCTFIHRIVVIASEHLMNRNRDYRHNHSPTPTKTVWTQHKRQHDSDAPRYHLFQFELDLHRLCLQKSTHGANLDATEKTG